MLNRLHRIVRYGFVTAFVLCGLYSASSAQDIARLPATNPNAPYVEIVTVPAGYKTYYISGGSPSIVDPNAPKGSTQRFGDTPTQTASELANMKKTLATVGLTFGDIVQAHVFLAPDPAKGGQTDFAGMNASWLKEFGTSEQPNKPARSTIFVGLATPGKLVEIEFIAVKATVNSTENDFVFQWFVSFTMIRAPNSRTSTVAVAAKAFVHISSDRENFIRHSKMEVG